MTSNNNVGDSISANRGSWSFNEIKHNNFQEHVLKSVPGYSKGHDYITFLSDYFISSGSTVYDIGCSTGSLISKLSNYHKNKKGVSFIGIEPSKGFKAEFIKNTSTLPIKNHSYEFIESLVEDTELSESDLFISYYTLQFIHPRVRQLIVDKIYNSLHWGGGFFLFEKVRGIDARFHEMINLAYLEYKQSVGYSDEEIISKMFSLKGVLEPFSSNENRNFLKRAGFKDISTISKDLCFEGILAIK